MSTKTELPPVKLSPRRQSSVSEAFPLAVAATSTSTAPRNSSPSSSATSLRQTPLPSAGRRISPIAKVEGPNYTTTQPQVRNALSPPSLVTSRPSSANKSRPPSASRPQSAGRRAAGARTPHKELTDVEQAKKPSEDRLPTKINLDLILRKNVVEKDTMTHEELIATLFRTTHIRLDRCNIEAIDNLDCLGPVSNLYLQNNIIQEIANLECLTQLRFLTLSSNRIQKVQGIASLRRLVLLDLSHNFISLFYAASFPKSLTFLHLEGNPCTSVPDYRNTVVGQMSQLQELDGTVISSRERRRAEGEKVDDIDDDVDSLEDYDDQIDDDEDFMHYMKVVKRTSLEELTQSSPAELQARIRSKFADDGRKDSGLESTRDAIVGRSKSRQGQSTNEYSERVKQMKR